MSRACTSASRAAVTAGAGSGAAYACGGGPGGLHMPQAHTVASGASFTSAKGCKTCTAMGRKVLCACFGVIAMHPRTLCRVVKGTSYKH